MVMKTYVKGSKVFIGRVAIDHVVGKFSHKLTSPQGFQSQYIYIQSIDTLYMLEQDPSSKAWSCIKRANTGIDNIAGDPLRVDLFNGMTFQGKMNCKNQDSQMSGICYRYDKKIVASMTIDYSLYTNATSAQNLPIQFYRTVSSQDPILVTTYDDYVLGPVSPNEFNLPVPESKCTTQLE